MSEDKELEKLCKILREKVYECFINSAPISYEDAVENSAKFMQRVWGKEDDQSNP